MYAGLDNNPSGSGGVWSSTDGGYSWTQTVLNSKTVLSLAYINNIMFAGTENSGIYYSTNNGTSWIQSSITNISVASFILNGNSIFAGAVTHGIYISTNNGVSWTQTGLNSLWVASLGSSGNRIFAGTDEGFFISSDNGANWTLDNTGMYLYPFISAILTTSTKIFAGTYNNSVWMRTLGEVTGIIKHKPEIISAFSLFQNYPNPFNPVTTIKFEVPETSHIKLSVFDVTGKLLETLIDREMTASSYEITWNADKYSSGVYFYRLEARQAGSSTGDYNDIKKMVLIK